MICKCIHRKAKVIAELLAAIYEASIGFEVFRDSSEGHPVHCFMIEEGLNNNKFF